MVKSPKNKNCLTQQKINPLVELIFQELILPKLNVTELVVCEMHYYHFLSFEKQTQL